MTNTFKVNHSINSYRKKIPTILWMECICSLYIIPHLSIWILVTFKCSFALSAWVVYFAVKTRYVPLFVQFTCCHYLRKAHKIPLNCCKMSTLIRAFLFLFTYWKGKLWIICHSDTKTSSLIFPLFSNVNYSSRKRDLNSIFRDYQSKYIAIYRYFHTGKFE